MTYQNQSLYERLKETLKNISNGLSNLQDFKQFKVEASKKVLVSKNDLFNNYIGTDFDFVSYTHKGFDWRNQTKKEEVQLTSRVIFRRSIKALSDTIEQDVLRLHSVRSVRKFLILINTYDEIEREYIVPHFLKNYNVFLKFPPYFNETDNNNIPLFGHAQSIIELWFYDEASSSLLPVSEYLEDNDFYKF